MGCGCESETQGGLTAHYKVIRTDGTEETFTSLQDARVNASMTGGKVASQPVYTKTAGETA